MVTIQVALIVLFSFISILHWLWAFGMKWLLLDAVPFDENGKPLFVPTFLPCAIVAMAFAGMAMYYVILLRPEMIQLPQGITEVLGWLIPSIFLIRAIGEFKYVGFFKKVKSTDFGKRDTRFFSPLCVLTSILGYFSMLF